MIRNFLQMACLSSLLALLVSPAQAAVIKALEFNVDGALPSTEPDIEFFTNSGQSQTTLYSVSGGLLHQLTRSTNGNSSYGWPNTDLSGGSLSAGMDLIMEARLQVLDIEGNGAFFQAFNGAYRYTVAFTNAGVNIPISGSTQPAAISLNVFQFHTYRIESPGNSNVLRLFIDGTMVFEGLAPASSTFNGFNWGDGITAAGNGADVDWDFVRVSQVPESATLLMFGFGLAALGVLVRRQPPLHV